MGEGHTAARPLGAPPSRNLHVFTNLESPGPHRWGFYVSVMESSLAMWWNSVSSPFSFRRGQWVDLEIPTLQSPWF